MKLNITITDLIELSEQQKEKLRYIWIPKERDLAVALICKSAESGDVDPIVFTVGKVEIDEFETQGYRSRYKNFNMTLRSLRLINDEFYETLEKEDDVVEDIELDYQTQDDFFSLNYCLPLLSIGQMLEILSKHSFSSYSFFINYNNDEKKYRIGRQMSTYNSECFEYESDELCDALWDAVKNIL